MEIPIAVFKMTAESLLQIEASIADPFRRAFVDISRFAKCEPRTVGSTLPVEMMVPFKANSVMLEKTVQSKLFHTMVSDVYIKFNDSFELAGTFRVMQLSAIQIWASDFVSDDLNIEDESKLPKVANISS